MLEDGTPAKRRNSNVRTALVLGSISLAFFAVTLLNHLMPQ
jgi:hypothetical protein